MTSIAFLRRRVRASGSARSDEPPATLTCALAELGAQALDAGLVDEVLGRQLERLLPGVERFAIAVLRAQRDPEIEQLDGALERVSFRFDGGRVANRVGQVRGGGV